MYNLTPAETRILWGTARKGSSKEVALESSIQPQTVKIHLYKVRKKLGVHTTAQAVYLATSWGVIPPAPPAKV